MKRGIIVCGCNGSGKSTLGKALAKKLRYKFIDIEDCYFPNRNGDDCYDNPLSHDEALGVLMNKIKSGSHLVLAAVKGDWVELPSLYQCAAHLSAPAPIRLQRLKDRSFQKFGNRMLPGGDLYEKEQCFFDRTALRTEREIAEWADSLDCPVIEADGTEPIEKNVEFLAAQLYSILSTGRIPAIEEQ